MTKETKLNIASWVELMLGAYFVLAFAAWFSKLVLLAPHRGDRTWVLFIPAGLAVVCFFLYARTRRALKELNAKSDEAVNR